MTAPTQRAAAHDPGSFVEPVNPVSRLLLFVLPITAVLAGVFSIGGVSPHAVTSGLVGLAGILALLTPRASVSPVARSVIWAAIAWASITMIHLAVRGVPLVNEVTIALSGFAILIGVSAIPATRRTLSAFLTGWTIAYCLSIGAALAEKFLGYLPRNNYLVLQGGRSLEVVGLSSFFGNPNGFALFLLASSIVFIPRMISATRRSTRMLYFVLQIANVYFMFQTNSRTGVTLLFLVLTAAIWISLSRFPMLRFFVGILALGLTALVFLGAANPALTDELARVSLLSDSSTDDGSFMVRFNLFLSGLLFLSENPLIGIGPNMFEQYMASYRSPYPTMGVVNPHGGATELLSGYGIIVFALFVILLVRLWRRAFTRVRSSRNSRSLQFTMALAQLIALAALPFASTMHSTFLGDPAAWLYLSAIIVLDRLSSTSEAPVGVESNIRNAT